MLAKLAELVQQLTADDLSSSYIRRTSLAIGARRLHHAHHSPQLSPVSPGSPRQSFQTSFLSRTRPQDPEMGGQSHVSFRQSFGTSAARPAAVDYTDSPMGTPPLRREGTRGDDSGFGFSVSSTDSDMHRRPRRRSSLTGPKYKWLSNNTGDEPGVDVRSERDEEMYQHLRGKANVTVVDYSPDAEAEDSNVRIDISGERFEHWLDSEEGERPSVDGKPIGVRWSKLSEQSLS